MAEDHSSGGITLFASTLKSGDYTALVNGGVNSSLASTHHISGWQQRPMFVMFY